jgi:translation initiation factor IF-1
MKQDSITYEGEVIQERGNAMFSVRLDNGHEVLCTISGKIRKNYIKIMTGDRVKIEMSPYDLTRGRIVTRINTSSPTGQSVNKLSNNKKVKRK